MLKQRIAALRLNFVVLPLYKLVLANIIAGMNRKMSRACTRHLVYAIL